MFRLKRKAGVDGRNTQDDTFRSFAELLHEYQSQAIAELCASAYSKLEAIKKLYGEDPAKSEQSSEMVRALVTDHGLLFPQTRERFYFDENHSMRDKKVRDEFYDDAARRMADGRLGLLARILTFAEEAYKKWKPWFESFISLERTYQGIQTLLDSWDEPCLKLSILSDDVGYYKGELGRLDAPLDVKEAVTVMDAWLQTTRLQFGQQEPFSGPQYLRDELNFTTSELYEFFAYILPVCIRAEEQYQICHERTREYEPVLASSQEEAWKEQVEAFWAEDLAQWRTALPALKQYLQPDLTRYQEEFFLSNCGENFEKQCVESLQKSFVQYLGRMEPRFTKEDEVSESAAAFFVGASCGDENKTLFLDCPIVIWQLFRSPVYRYIYQFEDRNWNLSRIIEYACVKFPLPVTAQSLKADEELYRGIVTACDMGCRAIGIPFQPEIWSAFWTCLQQSVQCLPFQKEDLFSVQYQFRGLLKFRGKGYPLLDQVLSKRLDAEFAASYIELWRGLMNRKTDAPNEDGVRPRAKAQKLAEFHGLIKTYRGLFQDPEADEEQVWDCLLPLCRDLRFNKIHVLPDGEEFKELAKEWEILPRAREGTISHFKSEAVERVNREGRKDTPHVRAIELILTEWTVLQCACEQARRELMEAILRLLDNQTE